MEGFPLPCSFTFDIPKHYHILLQIHWCRTIPVAKKDLTRDTLPKFNIDSFWKPSLLGASPASNFGGFSCQKLSGRRRQKETQESSGGVAHRSLGSKKIAVFFCFSRRNGDPGERLRWFCTYSEATI